LAHEETSLTIKDADLAFENSMVRVIALRESPKLELAGLSVGPFEEGKEYEIRLWLARELEKAGIVRIRDEPFDSSMLHKIHWTERIQAAGKISALPPTFYPKLRALLSSLKEGSLGDAETLREYELIKRLSRDIVDCRLKKIISLASTPGHKSHIVRNLTVEERDLYKKLEAIIDAWRKEILGVVEE